jgi:ketosteroid isomerase-like protein
MRSMTLFAALLLITPCWIVSAQIAPAEAELEREIRRLQAMEVRAVLQGDVAALETLWAEQFTVNNPQNGISPDRSSVIDRVRRGLIRYVDFQQRIEAIRIDADIAIVMGAETVVPKSADGSTSQPVHRRFTNIWKKSGTTWRIIARHANVVPGC